MAEENQRKPYDRWFENSLLTGFFLSFVCFFATVMLWPTRDLNTFWPALAIASAVATALPVGANLLRKQSTSRLIKCVFTSLMFSLMVSGMFGSIIGMSLVEDYAAAPALSQFASEDFDNMASGGLSPGQDLVSLEQVKAAVQEQRAIAAALGELDKTEKQISELPVSAPSKFIAQSGLAPARAELKLKELPADEKDRLSTVERYLPQAGHETSPGSRKFVANRNELANFSTRLHDKYSLWSWILERFGLI